jgi:hypothetical protein
MNAIAPVKMSLRRRVFAPKADEMSFAHLPGFTVGD